MAGPTRLNLKVLVDRHGVSGLARKVGVRRSTVHRWMHNTDPSPLAREKIKALHAEHDDGQQDATAGPRRQLPSVPSDTRTAPAGVLPSRRS